MLRFWRITALTIGLVAVLLLLLTWLLRPLTSLALEYRQLRRDNSLIAVYYVDMERQLSIRESSPLPSIPLDPSDTAPDGRRAFSLPTPGNMDVFLLTSDAPRRQLTHFGDFPPLRSGRDTRRANLHPFWSPDLNWIIFLSSDPTGRVDLYAIHPDGHGLRLLTDPYSQHEPVQPRFVHLASG